MINIYARSFMTATGIKPHHLRDAPRHGTPARRRWLPAGHWWLDKGNIGGNI